MVDTRELVLMRLLEVVAAIPNIRWAQRNNVEIPEERSLLPAVNVYDGDEETDDASDLGMRPPRRETLVRMQPEIVIVQQADEVGSELAILRRELIRRVLTDDKLQQIVKAGEYAGNGVIRYLGCQTDLGWGRSMQGGLLAQFMFMYSLKPNEL
jgi:hypothetical protein